jgi:uncharacterized protein
MRPVFAFIFLPAILLPSAFSQMPRIDRQSGAVCEDKVVDAKILQEKAEAGDAIAEYEMGSSIADSNNDHSDLELAMPWFRGSAEQGYAPAEYMYGSYFGKGRWQNFPQLIHWWTKAAEQGEVRAQLWLGVLYEQGASKDGVERDYVRAFKFLSMAAKQGNPDAQVTLGQMYEDGEGVPENYVQAAYWYRKAADYASDLGGAGAATNALAMLYETGRATAQDYPYVYAWYAFRDDTNAMRRLAQKMDAKQLAKAERLAKERLLDRPLCSSAPEQTAAPETHP